MFFSKSNARKDKNNLHICVVGLGGLGCEVVTILCMQHYSVFTLIDMDIVEVGNLRRQLLFSTKDVGSYKVESVCKFILSHNPHAMINTFKQSFQTIDWRDLLSVDVIVGCTDNLEARESINRFALVNNIVYIDGGSAGLGGQAQLIFPGSTPCFHCLACLFAPSSSRIPLCTIRSQPTLPEHCILYASTVLWEDTFHTFCDADDEETCQWVYEKALERSRQFSIEGVTLETTRLVLHDAIHTLPSTNTIIATFMTRFIEQLVNGEDIKENYIVYRGDDSVYIEGFWMERSETCECCFPPPPPSTICVSKTQTLQEVINQAQTQEGSRVPDVIVSIWSGSRVLYSDKPRFLRSQTASNLSRSCAELDLIAFEIRFLHDKEETVLNAKVIYDVSNKQYTRIDHAK